MTLKEKEKIKLFQKHINKINKNKTPTQLLGRMDVLKQKYDQHNTSIKEIVTTSTSLHRESVLFSKLEENKWIDREFILVQQMFYSSTRGKGIELLILWDNPEPKKWNEYVKKQSKSRDSQIR